MEENNLIAAKDGDRMLSLANESPPIVDNQKPICEGAKKKRRRGKSKRKTMKPFVKIPWQDRRKNDKNRNRFRKIVLAKTHAPFNNNQFLMEIHKPEPENIFQTPSARTRDSSFSVDSEDNYFYSLPEDEEEYLTKEFSSVYEDAQSERLSNMSKDDLIQEYLLLEAKYDNLVKRTERSKPKCTELDMNTSDKDISGIDKDLMITDKDTSGTSIGSSITVADCSLNDINVIMLKMKEQEEQIHELQLANEKLRLENEHLRCMSHSTSSEDSESDSSSSSDSDSSSNKSIVEEQVPSNHNETNNENHIYQNGQNDHSNESETHPLVNGFHSPTDNEQV